jgi:hypothetical protein
MNPTQRFFYDYFVVGQQQVYGAVQPSLYLLPGFLGAAGDDPLVPGERAPVGGPPPAGVKDGWVNRPARNGNWYVYQETGAKGDGNSIRIVGPTDDYQYGYVRFCNSHNRPIDLDGKPTGEDETHIPRAPDGSYDIPRGW